MGREGEGEEVSYETSLKLLDSKFKVIDSIEVSKGENVLVPLKNHGMAQFSSEMDSLYNLAVRKLNAVDRNLTYLTILGSSQTGVDSFADVQLIKRQVITNVVDTNHHVDGIQIRRYRDTANHYCQIILNGTQFSIDSLVTFYSSPEKGVFLGWAWTRVNMQGVKYYEINDTRYLVLHCEVMFEMKDGFNSYEKSDSSSEVWMSNLYQPIGWHHGGQEILFRME